MVGWWSLYIHTRYMSIERTTGDIYNEQIQTGTWWSQQGPGGVSPHLPGAAMCTPRIHVLLHSPNSLLLGVLNSFLRCVRPLCQCWCPPFSAGHVAFLFICLPGLSLLVSALFSAGHVAILFICNTSIHLFPRSVTGGVRPFPLAMQRFYSFVSQVCHC